MILLVAALWGCALANSQAQIRSKEADESDERDAIRHQAYEQQIKALAEQLESIRQHVEAIERTQDKSESYWWKGEQPPVWSNWILIVVAGLGGWVAYVAFTHQRDAVHLTQRADVLIASIGIKPAPTPRPSPDMTIYALPLNAQVTIVWKNYGPTRASNVDWSLAPLIEGISAKTPNEPHETPRAVIGAHDDIRPTTGPLNAYYDDAVVRDVGRGKTKLRIKASVTYEDVFGKRHTTTQYATYFNGAFRMEHTIEAD